jgi:hypothetical protein
LSPDRHRIAVLADSNVANLQHLKALEESAKSHGRELAGSILERIDGVPVKALVAIWGRFRGALASAACGRPAHELGLVIAKAVHGHQPEHCVRSAARENCIRDIADSLDRLAAT